MDPLGCHTAALNPAIVSDPPPRAATIPAATNSHTPKGASPLLMPQPSKHELDAPPWLRVESTLMSAARGIRRAYDARLSELGLNLSEAILLAHTDESGPLMQSKLAEHMGVGRAAMGSLIDALENRGWVERRAKPGDRRVWLIAITPSGEQAARQVAKIDERLRSELREGISRKERRELSQLLNRLSENVSKIFAEGT
jgi:MarR family transcriptional regulator for hemolysin